MITLKKQHRGYDKYESSGAGWLGSIPADWSTMKARYVFREINEKSVNGDETLLSVSEYYGVKPRGDVIDEGDWLTHAESLEGYKRCRKGDLVMNIMLAWKTGLGVSNFDGIVSPAYCVYRPVKKYHSRYLHYLLRTKLYTEEFGKSSTGIIDSRLRLYSDKFYKIPVVSPPLGVQQKIAEYLDEKCALIDDIIEGKEKQIEILEEQHAAIINRAATKGLDKNAEMKGRGVERVGKMPKTWEIKKLKTVFRFEKGKRAGLFTKEYVGDPKNIGEYPVYSGQTEDEGVMGRINSYIYDLDDTIFTTTVGAKVMTPMVIGGKFSLSQNCVLFIKQDKRIDVRYFYYQLFPMFKWEKDSIPSHMQPSLRVSDLNKYSIAFPIYEEQAKIANYIQEKTKFIDGFLKEIERSIFLLNEYKTSLISHVVTGRVKVA